ncbi:hypothetical protein FHL01_16345 [Cylindrospermopsis raciborskii CS-506_C]|nr:hypothetical protein [Cylindrospermopsis raciborskii]MBA4446732.1 hypothetical protein [Cylindrospermopsis raciborskii CS-506_C]
MSKLSIQERLNQLLPKLQDSRLLGNRGIGNEIGFYIVGKYCLSSTNSL